MATLKRYYRTNVDASPNQMVTALDVTRPITLHELSVENPSGNGNVYVSLYQETSGSVSVGTTTRTYGPKMVPENSQLIIGESSESFPLAFFSDAITVAITTTRSGSTSPATDCAVEILARGGA